MTVGTRVHLADVTAILNAQSEKRSDEMSLGIAFKGAEGIVLAADSRVTLMTQAVGQNVVVPATFDNAIKLLEVAGQTYVGAVTYGVGALGQSEPRTAHSFIPEFEALLTKQGLSRLSVQAFAQSLSDFFVQQWKALMPANLPPANSMAFLVGGYDEGQPYGRVFEFFVPTNPVPRETLPGQGAFGMTWGGQREFIDRLLVGFDDRLPAVAQQVLGLDDEKRDELRDKLKVQLGAPIPMQFLPLQDCVDLAILLIRSTIAIQRFTTGVRGVGGAIDVATITRTGGFRPVQRKSVQGEVS